jgi:hypothetical protein
MKSKFIFISLIFIFCLFLISATDYGNPISKETYEVSRDIIDRNLVLGSLFTDSLSITNLKSNSIDLSFSLDGKALEIIELLNSSMSIFPGKTEDLSFLVKAKDVGEYIGNLYISGSINEILPITIKITEEELSTPFMIETSPLRKSFYLDKEIYFQINVKKLKKEPLDLVSFEYFIYGNNVTYSMGKESKSINNSYNFVKEIFPPENLTRGNYVFEVIAEYGDFVASDKIDFLMKKPFMQIMIFNFIPMWVLVLIFSIFIVSFLVVYFIKQHLESKKKYKMKLDLKSIPQKSDEFLFLGKIAETNHPAYLDQNKLTTHSIVAGATGGGKSISAQVIIEEVLKKNIAVIVFDPTAQWSGMLRKCADKKMMAYYSKFGLKLQDAQAFKGNVRQVQNARQIIDIQKHINPGQIQIFSLNKLQPKEMDLFVANVIRQVFKTDPQESPVLKVLVVFDEVHRLLPKFGGSGEGFLQIERGCREFRKWGIGIMLVSQVLSDFVGEIKANISTEVQMRTRDEGDLGRINTKYGETFLQSLVKASVGVGMFSNPAYNHAKPYFVNFRPILHSTRRLPDEELEKYNKYNDAVDDLDFSINELEKLKVDTFDLKMELKLIKDKIMSGSFSVVEIYLEGLSPRVDKEWEKLGKKAPKRIIELASEEDIKKSIEEAKKQREKIEEKEAGEAKAKVEEKKAAEKLEDKQVAPLTFDNGVMIGSVKELKDYLPTMDAGIFSVHVNDSKNDIVKWITENFGALEGNKCKVKTKEELIKALETFDKKEEAPKKTELKKEVVKEVEEKK